MGSSTFSHYPFYIRYGLFALALVVIWGPLYYTSTASKPDSAPIDIVRAYAAEVPSAEARDHEIDAILPLNFSAQFAHHKSVVVEFQVGTPAPTQGSPYALYIPWLTGNASVYLNDNAITPPHSGPYTTVQSGYPLLINMDARLFAEQKNLISVVVQSEFVGDGHIEPVYFDRLSELEGNWKVLYFQKVTVVHLLSAALFLLIVIAACTHIFIQRDDLYVWFIVVGCSWILTNAIYLVVHFPGPDALRGMLFALGNLITISVLPIFARRYMNLENTAPERRYLWFAGAEAILLSLIFLLQPTEQADLIEAYIRLRALSCIVYIVACYRWHVRGQHKPAPLLSLWLISLALASMTFPLHSVVSFVTGWSLVPANYLLTGSVHLILVFATIYLSRVYQSFSGLRLLNQELDQRVTTATQEIESRYAQIQDLKQTQVVAKERERIMQDIHDGVAGHLVAALAIAKRRPQTDDRIIELMQTSVTDLRLVVDSMVTAEHDINQLLDSFRARTQPILASANIQLQWQVDLPGQIVLNPDQLLSLYRCLQEICTNVVRHSAATRVEVRGCDQTGKFALLEIVDDGKGLADDFKANKGLNNIKQRMQALGGRAELELPASGALGLRVCLWIPKPQINLLTPNSGDI